MTTERAATPQHCQCRDRKLRNLAKVAHRGRHGTSCPAMPTLRLPCRRGPQSTGRVRDAIPSFVFLKKEARKPCVKGQSDRRDQGTFELQSFGRVLVVLEFLRPYSVAANHLTITARRANSSFIIHHSSLEQGVVVLSKAVELGGEKQCFCSSKALLLNRGSIGG